MRLNPSALNLVEITWRKFYLGCPTITLIITMNITTRPFYVYLLAMCHACRTVQAVLITLQLLQPHSAITTNHHKRLPRNPPTTHMPIKMLTSHHTPTIHSIGE